MAISLLNEREYKITDRVTVFIPTLGEYRNKQNRPNYEMLMNFFLMTPSNYMLELHQAGRDFREISEYEFFIENFFAFFIVDKLNGKEVKIDSTVLFKDLDFTPYRFSKSFSHGGTGSNDNNVYVIVFYT